MAKTMTRYQPTPLPDVVNRLFNESFLLPSFWDRAYTGASNAPALPVNLFETKDGFIMQAALPGLNPDSVDIQVVGREISIKGSFTSSLNEEGTWVWRGIPTGDFYETYTLPVEVEGDKVEASYESGILTLNLPKAAHLRPRQIKVSVK